MIPRMVQWKAPEHQRPPRSVSPELAAKINSELAELRARPGEWALVEHISEHVARRAAKSGNYECTTRGRNKVDPDGGTRRHPDVYLRYVGQFAATRERPADGRRSTIEF